MKLLSWLLLSFGLLFADGSNQQQINPLWGQARLLNIDTYTDGLAPLWVYLQGNNYFAYTLVILVLAVVIAFGLHYLVIGPKHFDHHGKKIYAFNAFIRIMHALAAISWLVLVPSGAIMMWGESFGGGAFVRFAKNAHGVATIIFCVAVLPLLFSWLKRMLPAIYDIKWMLIVGGYLSKKKRPVPAGKFNAGQKSWFWIAFPGGLVMIATGAAMYFMDFNGGELFGISQIELLRGSALIHNALGIVCAVFLLVHIYMACFAIAGAIHAMIHGYKEEEEVYILHHEWYKELRKKGKIEPSKYEEQYKNS